LAELGSLQRALARSACQLSCRCPHTLLLVATFAKHDEHSQLCHACAVSAASVP
jgi:hypothetical protein